MRVCCERAAHPRFAALRAPRTHRADLSIWHPALSCWLLLWPTPKQTTAQVFVVVDENENVGRQASCIPVCVGGAHLHTPPDAVLVRAYAVKITLIRNPEPKA